jgi:hypothetical protein
MNLHAWAAAWPWAALTGRERLLLCRAAFGRKLFLSDRDSSEER